MSGSSELSTTLADGTELHLRVSGDGDIDRYAKVGLDAAAGAVAEAQSKPAKKRTGALGADTGIVGSSAPMHDLFRMLERIRSSNATVLVTGENGTGKELVARSIHQHSRRSKQRFVATNCSAFNDNLLESELFGHRRGAFTGAVSDKPGLFQVADGGTFFLDEVGDMSPALQVKLLRVLQEGVFLPVGATEQKRVDVRIIAATNRDLQAMVRDGSFREDLYYRLHVVALRVPPLRERREDIPLLVEHFLGRLGERDGHTKALSRDAMDRLMAHRWPGNVRELENEIERLWVLSGDDRLIGEEHLTPTIGRATGSPSRPSGPESSGDESVTISGTRLPEAVEQLERQMIAEGLRKSKGNKTRAAQALGISRRNLIRKVQSYGLEDAGKKR